MQMADERLKKLTAMLSKQPQDTFLLYGIALEHRKAGRTTQAIEFLDQVIALDEDYCYAYYQKGQIFEENDDPEPARQAYQRGLEAAQKKGDSHASFELQTALDLLV